MSDEEKSNEESVSEVNSIVENISNDDDDDDDDENVADQLTDMGLFNALGNFLTDDDGITVGQSLMLIAKELNKLNHNLKKFNKQS